MSKDVTSPKENDKNLKEKTDVQKEAIANPDDNKKDNLRYQSIEEAEKAKNETDQELAQFSNFVRVLTKEDAATKIEAMYELEPEKINRFYKKSYGKTYEEAIAEKENASKYSELKDSNPELYEMKKELDELRELVNNGKSQRSSDLIDSFVSQNPIISKDDLQSELDSISTKLPLEQRLAKAYKILVAEGKTNSNKGQAYISELKKQSAGIVAHGKNLRQDVINSKPTEQERITNRFNDPKTLPPSFRNI